MAKKEAPKAKVAAAAAPPPPPPPPPVPEKTPDPVAQKLAEPPPAPTPAPPPPAEAQKKLEAEQKERDRQAAEKLKADQQRKMEEHIGGAQDDLGLTTCDRRVEVASDYPDPDMAHFNDYLSVIEVLQSFRGVIAVDPQEPSLL